MVLGGVEHGGIPAVNVSYARWMNPARSLGPAVVSGQMASLWIYMVAPVGGAVLAVLASRFVHGPPPPPSSD